MVKRQDIPSKSIIFLCCFKGKGIPLRPVVLEGQLPLFVFLCVSLLRLAKQHRMFIPQTVTLIWSRGCYGNRTAWGFVFFFKIYKWRRGEQRREGGVENRGDQSSRRIEQWRMEGYFFGKSSIYDCPLTRIGLKKSRLDRKWLCALFSQSLEDLQMISWVRRDTLWSAMWTNSSSGVALQRSLRWKPKPFVRTWTEETESGDSGVGKTQKEAKSRVSSQRLTTQQWFKQWIFSDFTCAIQLKSETSWVFWIKVTISVRMQHFQMVVFKQQ